MCERDGDRDRYKAERFRTGAWTVLCTIHTIKSLTTDLRSPMYQTTNIPSRPGAVQETQKDSNKCDLVLLLADTKGPHQPFSVVSQAGLLRFSVVWPLPCLGLHPHSPSLSSFSFTSICCQRALHRKTLSSSLRVWTVRGTLSIPNLMHAHWV